MNFLRGTDTCGRPRVRTRRGLGFTLVELMVVIAIIGVVTGMAVMTSRRIAERQALDNARLAVDNTIRETRNEVFATGRIHTIARFVERIEVFTWDDADLDREVDWSDGNGNGVFDDGEGEVVRAFATTPLAQRGGLLSVSLEIAAETATALCDPAPALGDDNIALFLPNTGALVNAELLPCSAVIDLINAAAPTRKARIQSTPSGVVRSGLFGEI